MADTAETLTLAETLTERIRVNGTLTEASLSPEGRLRWREEGVERCLTVESEVLGFATEGSRIRVRAFVEELKGASRGGSCRKRVTRDFVLEPATEEAVMLWSEKLGECINSFGRPKRLFIIINPFGGKRCARKIFHHEIKPLLVDADISYKLEETKHHFHAQQIAYSLDLRKYDGIVCVSGDGVLVEVVNGLLQREDWETAIKVPLGIIPAGTGNGMAKSLLDSVGDMYSVSNAVFAVIRGHKRPLDVATVSQGEIKFYSVLMLTWGLIADVDIESEKYRWMGSTRLDFYCFLRIINLRKYHGHVSFVPAPGYEAYGEPIKQNRDFNGNNEIPKQGHGHDPKVPQCGYQGPVTCLESLEWRSLDGPFISVWLNNVPWSGEDIMPAPEAKFSDGYLDLLMIKDCPRSLLLGLLMKMNDGSHVKSPYIMYLKVKAFRLEPGHRVGKPRRGGIIDSDGEVIARGEGTYDCHQQEDLMAYGPPIQMTVDNGLATIFSPR